VRLISLAQTLDRGLLIEQEYNAKARRMIIKLSEACDKLPSSLFITGVSERDHDATFGGGFGDIYRASYGGKTVALKRMRMFHRGSEQRRIRLVCLKSRTSPFCLSKKRSNFAGKLLSGNI
jgi:hypothetical protein